MLLIGVFALAACGGPSGPGFLPPPSVGGGVAPSPPARPIGVPPPIRGVALLAPLTGPNAERGQALANAAKLALDAPDAPPLDVRDTGGTAQGAAEAARAAIAAGAGMIIGPLTAAETAGAAGVARPAGIPVLAFTNDPAQAHPGVWTLGITPAQQVRRMVGAEMNQGKNRFAAVLPRNDFGAAMGTALARVAETAGAPAPTIKTYEGSTASMDAAVRDIADYAGRMAPLMDQLRAAREARDSDGAQKATDLLRQAMPPPPFDALLLAETSASRLSAIVGLLGSYEVNGTGVRLLGPALWSEPSVRTGTALPGAWFAAPDPSTRAGFDDQYVAKYAAPAPGLADFAYDAASVARVLAQSTGYTGASLVRPDGFAGVDGVFALLPDGTVRRGLALFEIQNGSPKMIEPSPTSLTAPGI